MSKATKTHKKKVEPEPRASTESATTAAVVVAGTEPSEDTQRLHVAYRPVEALIPSARNARTHSEEQVAQVAASIREYGWTNPVLVDGENGVIAGHARLLAARKLGLRVVPVIELAHLTEAQRRAYMLADNQLALNAEWDADLLRIELTDLEALDIDLGSLGFSEEELSKFMSEVTDGATDPDSIPAPPDEPVTQKGDLWILGDHRLLCGDIRPRCRTPCRCRRGTQAHSRDIAVNSACRCHSRRRLWNQCAARKRRAVACATWTLASGAAWGGAGRDWWACGVPGRPAARLANVGDRGPTWAIGAATERKARSVTRVEVCDG